MQQDCQAEHAQLTQTFLPPGQSQQGPGHVAKSKGLNTWEPIGPLARRGRASNLSGHMQTYLGRPPGSQPAALQLQQTGSGISLATALLPVAEQPCGEPGEASARLQAAPGSGNSAHPESSGYVYSIRQLNLQYYMQTRSLCPVSNKATQV